MKRPIFYILYSIFSVLLTAPAYAQDTLPNPLGVSDIPTLLGNVIKAALGVVGSISLLMFIYGGLTWLTAAGNDKKIEKGKAVLTWAVIGLVVIFASFVIVNFVIKGLTSVET